MRLTQITTVLIALSISAAFAGILFLSLSWILLSCTFFTVFVYAWHRFSSEIAMTSLDIKREILDQLPFAGEPMTIKIEIINRGSSIINGELEDLAPDGCPITSGTNNTTRNILSKTSISMTYTILPGKRGEYEFPGVRISRTDAFGLLTEEQMIEKRTTVKVHTERETIDAARRLAAKEHFEYTGMARHLALAMRDLEFDSIRDYVPGDRSRDIHWKLLSKLDKLMTKVYRKEGALQTTIFVDCSRSMRTTENGISKLDHSVDLSIHLAEVLLSNFYPVGVTLIDEVSIIDEIPPGMGRHHFEKIISMLRNAPEAMEARNSDDHGQRMMLQPRQPPGVLSNSFGYDIEEGSKEFIRAFETVRAVRKTQGRAIGLDGAMRTQMTHNKGQKLMYIVLTDLISSCNAVISGVKLCQRTGNKMLVLHTYDDWYRVPEENINAKEAERLYETLLGFVKIEALLKGLGGAYVRIGPGDLPSRIVRAMRRGKG